MHVRPRGKVILSGSCKQCTGRRLMFFATQKHKHILFPGGGGGGEVGGDIIK